MEKVLQERCSSAWCLSYATGPRGFKPIFLFQTPSGLGNICWADLAHTAILSSQYFLLSSWHRLVVNHSLGEGSPLNFSFYPNRYTPTSLTYRRVSQLTASTSFRFLVFGFLWGGKEGLGSPQVKSRIAPDSPALEVHPLRPLEKSLNGDARKQPFSWLCFIRKEQTLLWM